MNFLDLEFVGEVNWEFHNWNFSEIYFQNNLKSKWLRQFEIFTISKLARGVQEFRGGGGAKAWYEDWSWLQWRSDGHFMGPGK